jgi:ankyrin repeat protein
VYDLDLDLADLLISHDLAAGAAEGTLNTHARAHAAFVRAVLAAVGRDAGRRTLEFMGYTPKSVRWAATTTFEKKNEPVFFFSNLPSPSVAPSVLTTMEETSPMGFIWSLAPCMAAYDGRAADVARLLEGADVHVCNRAMRMAVGARADVVLDAGADVHADNYYALREMARNGYTNSVRLLLSAGADNDYALRYAAENGQADVVRRLLDAGANVHADDDYAMRYAARADGRADGHADGHADVVRLLLDAGANVHARDDVALRYAATCGYNVVVRILVDAGANVHARDDAALWIAAQNGHADVVRMLLGAGADVHALNDYALRNAVEIYSTELICAKRADIVRLLLNAGADVHACDNDALRCAARNGYANIADLLLSRDLAAGTGICVLRARAHAVFVRAVLAAVGRDAGRRTLEFMGYTPKSVRWAETL